MTITASVQGILIDKIFANPNQPRKLFDQVALQDLAASILENGLMQPITVVKRDEGYMIVAGERRYRACKLTGLTKVDCVVKKLSEVEIATMAIVENLQRKDVTPLEEAFAFRRMLDEGYANDGDGQPSIKVLAQKLGIKQPFRISERLRLLVMIPAAQQAFTAGQITTNAAWYIAALSDDRKQQMLLDACLSGKCATNDRLKATYDSLLKKNLDQQVEQSGLDLGLLDPAIQSQINALQKTIETAAATMSSLVIDEKLAQVSGSISGNQAELMAKTLANLAATAKQLEKQMVAELVQAA